MVRWSWMNFQCWCISFFWLIVGQGLTALTVGAGGDCLDGFSLWETARYRLKYYLKGPLSPKQPTNQLICHFSSFSFSLGDGPI